jgi:hypothetical protein
MIEIRLVPPNRREFRPDVYRPGIISLSRIVWGSVGGGLSWPHRPGRHGTGVGVLYPPLAATCFIGATCSYLRVARPQSVIVGHFIATVGGLLGVHAGELLAGVHRSARPREARPGRAPRDRTHANCSTPTIRPRPPRRPFRPPPAARARHDPAPAHGLGRRPGRTPGRVWNRFWFECPPPEEGCGRSWFNLGMERADIFGAGNCAAAALLMCAGRGAGPPTNRGYGSCWRAGRHVPDHFFGAKVLVGEAATCCTLAKPATGGPPPYRGSTEKEEKHER